MTDVIFNGPEGRLEGRYQQSSQENAPIVLLLHPHPQGGGTMNNKVVFSLFNAFTERRFAALRFNFRGVGRSQGHFDNGPGELSDAAASLDWLQSHNPDAPRCWIVGFSFGGWVGMQLLMRRPEIEGFITIAPPANLYDFSFLAPCPSSGLVVHGADDELVPVVDVEEFAKKLAGQRAITVDHVEIPGANHFFQDHIDDLVKVVGDYMDNVLKDEPALKAS